MKLLSLILFISISLHKVYGVKDFPGKFTATSKNCANGALGSNLILDAYVLLGVDNKDEIVALFWGDITPSHFVGTDVRIMDQKFDMKYRKHQLARLPEVKNYVVVLLVRAASVKYDNPIFYGFDPKMWHWDESSYADISNPFYHHPWRIDSATFTMTNPHTNKEIIKFEYVADSKCDNPGTWIGNHGTYRLNDKSSNVPNKGEISNLYYAPRYRMVLT